MDIIQNCRIQMRLAVKLSFLILAVICATLVIPSARAQEANPVTRAVLFFSPTCGHCEYVIKEVLPPLAEQYGSRLTLLLVDVTQPQGQQLYQNAIEHYQISSDRLGVPTLVCGQTILVGSREIPEQFPTIIESSLAVGGTDWPAIPGLAENLPDKVDRETASSATEADLPPTPEPGGADAASTTLEPGTAQQTPGDPDLLVSQSEDTGIMDKFKQDPTANSLAVIVLLVMLASSLYILLAFLSSTPPRLPHFPRWTIPVLTLAGLGVAIYLSYVEVFQADAVCGPVGNCNAVQNSPYAYLFGVIPIGVLGALGYLAILFAWLLAWRGPTNLHRAVNLAAWGMAWVGTLFSIYLTFLEPFVIGATCMWCLTSAVIMTILLWATTPAALQALQHPDDTELDFEPDN